MWEMTPQGRKEIYDELRKSSSTENFITTLTLNRNSVTSSVVTFSFQSSIESMKVSKGLADVIMEGRNHSVVISDVLPRVIKMPGTSSDATEACTADDGSCPYVSINFTYHAEGKLLDTNDYWDLKQIYNSSYPQFDSTTVTQLLLINTPVSSDGSILGRLAALGLIGLYTGVVLYVANIIRGFTSNWTQRIMFWNLPDPRRLMRLCQDIILARMDGDLLLEEELSNELLQIYRSPESLIENTRLIVSPDENDDGEDADAGNIDDDIDDDDDDDESAAESRPSHLRHRRAGQP